MRIWMIVGALLVALLLAVNLVANYFSSIISIALGGDRPYTLADLNRRPSNATPFTGHPGTRLATDLAEFYTLVEPYGFRDIYGFDFHSLTDDMIRHLRTREDVMAARGWLESVLVPDTGADAWRHGLISDLDGYMATISPNRRPSRRVFRRH